MADNQIGALPVMHDGKLAGIITETDLFKIFLELLGAREPGVRLTVKVEEGKGILPLLTGTISRLEGHVLALTTWSGEEPGTRVVTVKVSGVDRQKLVSSIGELGIEFLDVRES